MSFDADYALAVEDHFLHFGRTITFQPATGNARSLEVIFAPVEQDFQSAEYEEEEREEIWVEVRRDESHANGGIAEPRTGDRFAHPDDTIDRRPYAYQGRKRNVNPTTWELLYGRPVHEAKGFVSRDTGS